MATSDRRGYIPQILGSVVLVALGTGIVCYLTRDRGDNRQDAKEVGWAAPIGPREDKLVGEEAVVSQEKGSATDAPASMAGFRKDLRNPDIDVRSKAAWV